MAGVIATVDAGNGATVEKDAKIATIYPNNAMQIKMVISEADLMDVTVGRARPKLSSTGTRTAAAALRARFPPFRI